MKVLDLFAGVGGFRFGMEAAGHQTIGWVERDKYARQAYQAIHQPEGEWTHDDIRTIDYRELSRADIWTFGFPCQDISVAGNQTGFRGNRSSLFFATTKLLRQIKEWRPDELPTYLVIENVKNFLSVNGGWDFLLAQIELDEIGYDCEWQLLNSKDFGVPQNRERVFIIGHLRGRSGGKVFPITGESEKTSIQQIVGGRQGERVYDPTGLSCTLSAQGGGWGAKTGLYLIGNVNPSGKGMNGQVYDSKGISPTLTTNKGEGLKIVVRAINDPERVNKTQNGRRMKEEGEPMFTLTTQDRHGVFDGYRIRKLTPLECFRLQGFPDWAFYRAKYYKMEEAKLIIERQRKKGKHMKREISDETRMERLSDSQLYKMAGNSVTTTVVYEIAKRLK